MDAQWLHEVTWRIKVCSYVSCLQHRTNVFRHTVVYLSQRAYDFLIRHYRISLRKTPTTLIGLFLYLLASGHDKMDNIEQSLECTAIMMLQAMLDTLFIRRKNRTLLCLSIISQVTTTSLLLLHSVSFILFGVSFRESSFVFIEKTYSLNFKL